MSKHLRKIILPVLCAVTVFCCLFGILACKKKPKPDATTYTVTIENAEHGTVTADCEKACEGDKVTLTVTPDEEYYLDSLTVNGKETEVKSGKATFTMPAENVKVKATFVSEGKYAVRLGTYGHLSVKSDKTEAKEGETVKLTVSVDYGYTLAELKMNGTALTATGGKAEFVMPKAAAEITASAALAQNVKTGAAVTDFELSSKIMSDTANSHWSTNYGAEALEITVYVNDNKVSETRDGLEIYVGRFGYDYTKLSAVNHGLKVTADGTVTQYAVDGNEYVTTDEGAFTVVEAAPWSENGTDVSGYYVKVSVAYEKLGLAGTPDDGSITLLPVLANYTGSMGNTAVYNGYSKTNAAAYPVLKGGKLEENYYAHGTGVLGSTSSIKASANWDLSKDYAPQDTENYPNRQAVLHATAPDDDLLFFRNEGKNVYAEATFRATAVNNNENLGKFGLMLFDGASKNGVFYYVGADASGSDVSSITGNGVGYTLTSNGNYLWGHDNVATNVYDKNQDFTLKMAYVAERGYLYVYYTPVGGGEDVLVETIRYKTTRDVTIGFKSFNIDLTVTNYFCTNDMDNEAFAAHVPAPRFMGNNLGGTEENADYGSRWDITKDYKADASNYEDREVKLTGHDGADNNLYFIATEGKDAYVRATFKVDEVFNGEKWGKFGFMLFDGSERHTGTFFYVDAWVGNGADPNAPGDGIIRGRQLGYNYAPNGWGAWNGLNKAGDVFNLDTKTITLAMSYKNGVLSMYYENAQGQDVLVNQLVYAAHTDKFIIGIKSFAIGLTVTDYKAVTDPNDAEFAAHAPAIEKKDIDVLFAGDSYMEFWKNYGVWDTLTSDLTATGKKLENVGVGGTQVPYWDNGGMTGALKMQYNTQKVVFHIGVNDIDGQVSVEDTYSRLVGLFTSYHSAFPDAEIYWVSLIPNNFYIKNGGTYNAEYKQLNQKVKTYIDGVNYLHYIDVETPFTDEEGNARTNLFQNDGLHLNPVYGYPLWTSVIKEALGYQPAATDEKLGDLTDEHLQRKATSGWSYGTNGNLAEIGQGVEFGKNINVEEAVYYKDLYGADVLFEADIRSNHRYNTADANSKPGVMLVNDKFTIFAYLTTNADEWQNDGTTVQWYGLLYRNNVYNNDNKPVGVGDWNWSTMGQFDKQIPAINICEDFHKLGIAKLGATFYLLLDGQIIRECTVPGVTADMKFSAGVMTFNRYMEVRSVKSVSGADEVGMALATPHNIIVPTYEGVTITPNKTSAKKTENITFTVNPGDSTIDKVYVTYGGSDHELTADNGVYSFVMPDEDVAIKVTFLGKMSVTLGADIIDKLNASSLSVTQGKTVTFTAKDGYAIGKLYATDESGTKTEIVADNGVYTLTVNENVTISGEMYVVVDGIVLDGVLDSAYGTNYTEALLSDKRNMQVWAKKTASGVLIYAKSHSNEFKNDGGDGTVNEWWDNSNFEFYLNDGVQRCINSRDFSSQVTKFYTVYNRLTSGEYNGKWENIYEIFVAKDSIPNFDNGDVQLNYAFKTGNGRDIGLMMSDGIRPNISLQDWWGTQLIGGCLNGGLNETSKIANLMIGADGVYTVERQKAKDATIDGDLSEFAGKASLNLGNENASFNISAFAGTDGLYMGITITHNSWSSLHTNDWSHNDNLEMKVNWQETGVFWLNGELHAGAFFTQAAFKDVQSGGKITTTLELYIPGTMGEYILQMGCNGGTDGFNGWQSLIWGDTFGFITADGIITTDPAEGIDQAGHASGIHLDGVFDEASWTTEAKSKTFTTSARGAQISVMGVNASWGTLIGVTINHNVALADKCQEAGNDWWHFQNLEIYLAGRTDMHVITAPWNNANVNCRFAVKTVENESGDYAYTTTYEIFVDYWRFATNRNQSIGFSIGGVFETGYSWLWGGDANNITHRITANGMVTA